MRETRAASRYAKALLDLSIEQNSLDKVNDDMVELAMLCHESKDLENLLHSPIVDRKKKRDIFEAIFGKKMDKLSLGFINLIIKNSRENILPEIAESFVSQFKKHKNIVDVTLISAVPLEKGAKDKILAKIKESVKGTVVLTEEVDSTLIGGFIIKMDDKQIDASIASQITNLKNILLN